MRYYIITGEASGDLHASNLIRELKRLDANASFRCWGGERMKEQGCELAKHYRETAYMGFTDVALHLGKIRSLIAYCRKDILSYQPDVLILVDYPGFNLRMAKFARRNGFRVIYYISPQVWAWNPSRVRKIKARVDHMIVILPFEKDFYAQYDYPVEYVGHPLLDAIDPVHQEISPSFQSTHSLDTRPIIALLPGSRRQEIRRILPIMLSVVSQYTDYQFVVAGLFELSPEFYQAFMDSYPVRIVWDQTYSLLRNSVAAMVTSGTATLETALHDVPQVICYRGEALSYIIARKLIRVPYIGLVNLIMGEEIASELIQGKLNHENLLRALNQILEEGGRRDRMIDDYQRLKSRLGGKGASERAARSIYRFLQVMS